MPTIHGESATKMTGRVKGKVKRAKWLAIGIVVAASVQVPAVAQDNPYLLEGYKQLTAGDYQAAIDLLTKGLQLAPNDQLGHYYIAQAYQKLQGDSSRDALRHYERCHGANVQSDYGAKCYANALRIKRSVAAAEKRDADNEAERKKRAIEKERQLERARATVGRYEGRSFNCEDFDEGNSITRETSYRVTFGSMYFQAGEPVIEARIVHRSTDIRGNLRSVKNLDANILLRHSRGDGHSKYYDEGKFTKVELSNLHLLATKVHPIRCSDNERRCDFSRSMGEFWIETRFGLTNRNQLVTTLFGIPPNGCKEAD